MPSSPPYQASTQLLQLTHYILATTCKYDGELVANWRLADVAFECITQFTVEGDWYICKPSYLFQRDVAIILKGSELIVG